MESEKGKRVVRSYRDLEVYQLAFAGAVAIHRMTMKLPKFEMYEVGRQIRKSAKAIPAHIAEGFGRRRYKNEYIRFLIYALSSCDETQVHLDMLHATGSIDDETYRRASEHYDKLGRKLNRFLQSVIESHVEPYRESYTPILKEPGPTYTLDIPTF